MNLGRDFRKTMLAPLLYLRSLLPIDRIVNFNDEVRTRKVSGEEDEIDKTRLSFARREKKLVDCIERGGRT